MSSLSSPPTPPGLFGPRAGAGPRLLRAAVFTAVCVALSATGHALAACAAVPWWTLLAGFAGMFVLVLPFTGRTRSLPSITLALGLGQLALHSLFGLGQQHELRLPPTADDMLIRMAAKLTCGAGAASLSPSEAHQIVTLAGLNPPAHTAQPVARPELLPSLPMLLAHLLAALATGWLLRRGDLALTRLAGLSARSAREVAAASDAARLRPLRIALALVRALCAGLVRTSLDAARARRGTDDPPPPRAGEALQHTVIRRGPPARFVLAA
ncbi:hypothetical protein GCM10010387_07000 [Streptomyces inusitatus]|uniref:Integral membrane protein n=1 Tax=Streptomyces inusitatus TaxID=68221 RepID=A0A918UKI2_9ACTN|nr:hypothetical protein [Streptomyces inusitatus]GGZ16966.1 hypothetical protein GCM10010387_07000 [Streptomyces inusitatus]